MHYQLKSRLTATVDDVWNHITTGECINYELFPFVRMTGERHLQLNNAARLKLNEPLGISCLLLFCLVPFGRMAVTLTEYREKSGFVEQSPMTMMKLWRHERQIEPEDEGVVLVDTLEFQPIIAGFMLSPLIQLLFQSRHHRLRKKFAGAC